MSNGEEIEKKWTNEMKLSIVFIVLLGLSAFKWANAFTLALPAIPLGVLYFGLDQHFQYINSKSNFKKKQLCIISGIMIIVAFVSVFVEFKGDTSGTIFFIVFFATKELKEYRLNGKQIIKEKQREEKTRLIPSDKN